MLHWASHAQPPQMVDSEWETTKCSNWCMKWNRHTTIQQIQKHQPSLPWNKQSRACLWMKIEGVRIQTRLANAKPKISILEPKANEADGSHASRHGHKKVHTHYTVNSILTGGISLRNATARPEHWSNTYVCAAAHTPFWDMMSRSGPCEENN